MADLKTNYKDDVLNTEVNERRKYQMIQNDDGTVSFVDVTDYSQVGDSFGAVDINATNEKCNEINNSLNDKQNTITGASSTVVTNNLTANRVLLSNSSGKIAVSSITNTQLGYLSGVSSNIQTQLNSKMTLVASTKSQTSSTTYSFTMDNGSNMYLVAARSWGAVYSGAMVWLVSSITSNYQFAIPLTESGIYAPTISVSGQKVTIKSGISDAGIIYSIYKL